MSAWIRDSECNYTAAEVPHSWHTNLIQHYLSPTWTKASVAAPKKKKTLVHPPRPRLWYHLSFLLPHLLSRTSSCSSSSLSQILTPFYLAFVCKCRSSYATRLLELHWSSQHPNVKRGSGRMLRNDRMAGANLAAITAAEAANAKQKYNVQIFILEGTSTATL